MKTLGNLLFIIVLFVLGYAIYPSLSDHFGWNKEQTDAESSEDIADSTEGDEDTTTTPTSVDTSSSSPTTTTPTTQVTTSSDTPSLEERFPYPNIESLEQITKNWTAVPERALPEKVTLTKDLKFQLGTIGSATKPAGQDVYPVGTDSNGNVRVVMSPLSENETTVPMDDTDFKERVTQMYETGVSRIRANIDKQREEERARIASASTITEAEKAKVNESASSTSNDEIDIMKASISSGELDGLTLSDITTFRKLGYQKSGQDVFQVGAAVYDVKTMFGTFQTEAKALIRNGRVVSWERMDE